MRSCQQVVLKSVTKWVVWPVDAVVRTGKATFREMDVIRSESCCRVMPELPAFHCLLGYLKTFQLQMLHSIRLDDMNINSE